MSTQQTEAQRARNRLGGLKKSRAADDPELIQAQREHHVFMLEKRAREVAKSFGPIPADVADRIVAILRESA